MTNKNNQCDAAVNYGSIHQLNKKEDGKERKPIFPVTPIQAVYDARTGASLEAILAQFNAIYVQYQGTPEATRNIIPEVMRRAGLTITYMDMESNTITERANSAVQKDNDHWGLDVNWSRVDELSLSGDISVSSKGTWIINGKDTGVKALGPKGNTGLTPWLKTIDNKLHFSYDNVTWEPCSENIAAWFRFNATSSDSQAGTIGRIQISRDNKTWTDLSPEFRNYLRVQGYVATTSALPANQVVGTIYGVGPTYAADDTAHTNPIYRLHVWNGTSWVDNGQFTSIAAGVVQETGDSETEVMSQKAVTEKLTELASEVGLKKSFTDTISGNNGTQLLFSNLNIKNGETFSIKLIGTIGRRTILRYDSISTNTIADYMIADTWYKITAPSDISSLYLWYDNSVDLTCELRKGLSEEVNEHADMLSDIVGLSKSFTDIIDGSNGNQLLFSNLGIKSGDTFSVRLTGEIANRTLLRYNSSTTNNLIDYMETNVWYQLIAPSDISSLYLWYNESVDLTCELRKGLGAEIKKQNIILNEAKGIVATIQEEVQSGNSRKIIFSSLNIKKGDEFCVRLNGESEGRLIIRYNNPNSSDYNLKDYAELNTWYWFIAPADISSLYLWYDKSVDLTCELRKTLGTEGSLFDILKKSPLSNLPEYIVNTMAYKPLGTLEQGCLCLSDDDGTLGLITYTIPMLMRKNFPVTFSLMKESEVMNDDSYIQQIKNAIETIGCSVAQHGGKNWTEYSECGLYDFFRLQSDFFLSQGIHVNGAVVPSHYTSKIIEGVAGGIFSVVRCGYDGKNGVGEKNYHTIYDNDNTYATSIARSNMYCLSSCNVLDYTIETWKSVIDNAIRNKKLLNIYFHDVDFTDTAVGYEANRRLLESVIDYAITSGIKVVQLGDIPTLK